MSAGCRFGARSWPLLAAAACVGCPPVQSRPLEIHYINVGQGGATLIVGPNGTKILYDFGRVAGRKHIVPYLTNVAGIAPVEGIHFAIVSHGDKDHYVGYKDVVAAGYDVLVANFGPRREAGAGPTMVSNWLEPAEQTRAGPVRAIPLGLQIDLGDGAQAIVIAANGVVLGEEVVERSRATRRRRARSAMNENDRSIALFVRFGKFHYVLDGDLGAGPEQCSAHDTSQRDVQSRVATALLSLGFLDESTGVDVLHIAHHGSESSTSWAYYQMMRPEVGVISVGPDQGSFLHPRVDVVERVLTCRTRDGKFHPDACEAADTRAPCIPAATRAPALTALLQTDFGSVGTSSTGSTSFIGDVAGDIKIETDGHSGYALTWTGRTLEPTGPGRRKPLAPGSISIGFDEDDER